MNPGRTPVIAGNWKMNPTTRADAIALGLLRASGQLAVTPVNPSTGEMGEPQQATVQQEQFAKLWPGMASISRRFTQTLVPVASAEGGRSSMFLQWGPNGKTAYSAAEKCGM